MWRWINQSWIAPTKMLAWPVLSLFFFPGVRVKASKVGLYHYTCTHVCDPKFLNQLTDIKNVLTVCQLFNNGMEEWWMFV